MNNERPRLDPEQAEGIKELFTQMEREEHGDAKATKEDFLVALEFAKRYIGSFENNEFLEKIDKGEFFVKEKWGTNKEGKKLLSYLEIRGKDGKVLFMEDFEALDKIEEEMHVLARPRG